MNNFDLIWTSVNGGYKSSKIVIWHGILAHEKLTKTYFWWVGTEMTVFSKCIIISLLQSFMKCIWEKSSLDYTVLKNRKSLNKKCLGMWLVRFEVFDDFVTVFQYSNAILLEERGMIDFSTLQRNSSLTEIISKCSFQ